jgi:hypothetical protein
MRVVYAFLADSATDAANGKTDIVGLGLDHVFAAAVPALHPHLTLVCRLEATLTECDVEHQVRIELWGPDGERMVQVGGAVTPHRNTLEPHQPSSQTIVLNFEGLVFPVFGDYGFHILIDNLELGTVPFYVRQATAPTGEEHHDDGG